MAALRSLIAATVAVCTIGCYSWKPVRLDVNPDASTRPSRIEISTQDRARYTLFSPEVRGDSLHGWFDDSRSKPASFAVIQIVSAQVRQRDVPQVMGVAMAVAAVAVVGVVAFLYIVLSTGPDS
jgi:hypothetical protein